MIVTALIICIFVFLIGLSLPDELDTLAGACIFLGVIGIVVCCSLLGANFYKENFS